MEGSHTYHNSLTPSCRGVVGRLFNLEGIAFYSLSVHFGPCVGHFVENSKGKCSSFLQSVIQMPWKSTISLSFFLIREAKTSSVNRERRSKPRPKVVLPLLSSVLLSLVSIHTSLQDAGGVHKICV